MRNLKLRGAVTFGFVAMMGWAALAAGEDDKKNAAAGPPAKSVKFPTGYRGWTYVKSMLIYSKKHPLYDAFGGIHGVYANDKALKALKSTREFPVGSVFVFDLREANEAGGAYVEGKRKFVAAMVRDPKAYQDTEGWGWQAWDGGDEKKPVLKGLSDQKACATCHKEVGAKGFVFTEWNP